MGHSESWVNFAFRFFSTLIMEAAFEAFPREKVIDRRTREESINSVGVGSDGSMERSKEKSAT